MVALLGNTGNKVLNDMRLKVQCCLSKKAANKIIVLSPALDLVPDEVSGSWIFVSPFPSALCKLALLRKIMWDDSLKGSTGFVCIHTSLTKPGSLPNLCSFQPNLLELKGANTFLPDYTIGHCTFMGIADQLCDITASCVYCQKKTQNIYLTLLICEHVTISQLSEALQGSERF